MKYCSECAAPLSFRIPEGDHLPRAVCDSCGTIHYENPKLVAGAIVESEGRILLCRRAIAPRRGFWTAPAGFMENNETTADAAIRETWEEAGARIELGPLFSMVDLPRISQVHLFFLATLVGNHFAAGTESLEVRLFAEEEIPWDEVVFRSTKQSLRHYFDDRRRGQFGVHTFALD